MSIKLRELIRNVRACKTAAEERSVIAKESALIRTKFKEKVDSGFRHRNVAKLLYINMLGYPTHFGHVESLKLIASAKFPEKRIGYLGLMILLDERTEVLMLVTNSLKNDMTSDNPYVAGMALCALGNVCSTEMARDLSPEVEKLFKHRNPYIRKKAALCAIRVVRKVPEMLEDYIQPVITLLSDKNHAVLLTAVSLIIEMIELDSSCLKQFRKLVPTVVRILKTMVLAGYVSEYDVCGITDPFLQAKIIRLLRLLGKGSSEASDEMNDILAQVAINTESTKNPGNAILYECVQTIMSIEAEGGLRVLAVNILGRFLLNRDNNIRYVALNTLCKAVQSDTKAIQRHRNLVVDCLKDADVSIRRRALDLIYALVTKANVRALVKELLNYLALASGDREFKAELTDKICVVVDKYAPSKHWHIDTTVQILATAGDLVREAVPSNLIALISRTKSLHAYSAHKLCATLNDTKSNELPLIHVGVWCIGEYGENLVTQAGVERANIGDEVFKVHEEGTVLDMLDSYIKNPHCNATTRSYVLNALVKLSGRFKKSSAQIKKLLSTFKTSMSVELQQRSCEYTALLGLGKIRDGLVVKMPAPEAKKAEEKKAGDDFSESSDEPTEEDTSDDDDDDDDDEEEDTAKASGSDAAASKPVANQQVDLLGSLDFLTDPTPQSTSTQPVANGNSNSSNNNEIDLLGGLFAGAPITEQKQINSDPLAALMGGSSSDAPAPAPSSGPSKSSEKVFDKNGLSITFNMKRPTPSKCQVQAVFSNSTGEDFTKFDFKVAVPKYIKLQLKQASSNTVAANSSGAVTQLFQCENSQHPAKKLMLRVKIDYYTNSGGHVTETTQINLDQ